MQLKQRSSVMAALFMAMAIASSAPAAEEAKPAAGTNVTFNITGMTWNGCAAAVVTAYKSAEGVVNVAPDVKAATVTITYNAAKTDPDKLIKAMTNPKFTVSKQAAKK